LDPRPLDGKVSWSFFFFSRVTVPEAPLLLFTSPSLPAHDSPIFFCFNFDSGQDDILLLSEIFSLFAALTPPQSYQFSRTPSGKKVPPVRLLMT